MMMLKKTILKVAVATTVLAMSASSFAIRNTGGSLANQSSSSSLLSKEIAEVSSDLISGNEWVASGLATLDASGEPNMQMVFLRFDKSDNSFTFFLDKSGSAAKNAMKAPIGLFLHSKQNPGDYVTFRGDAKQAGVKGSMIKFKIKPKGVKIVRAKLDAQKIVGSSKILSLGADGSYQVQSQYSWRYNQPKYSM